MELLKILLQFWSGIFCSIEKSNKFITFESVKSRELVKLLKNDGWFVVRQSGSHMILKHPIKKGQIVCPYHGSAEVGKGLEIKIKKDAGLI